MSNRVINGKTIRIVSSTRQKLFASPWDKNWQVNLCFRALLNSPFNKKSSPALHWKNASGYFQVSGNFSDKSNHLSFIKVLNSWWHYLVSRERSSSSLFDPCTIPISYFQTSALNVHYLFCAKINIRISYDSV